MTVCSSLYQVFGRSLLELSQRDVHIPDNQPVLLISNWFMYAFLSAWKSQQMIGEIDHQLHRPRHWNGTQWTHVGTLHLNGKDPNGFSPFPPPNVYSNNLPAWAIYSGNNELSWNVLESNIKPFKLTDDLSHTRYSSALMSDSDKMSLRRMSGRYMTACDWWSEIQNAKSKSADLQYKEYIPNLI